MSSGYSLWGNDDITDRNAPVNNPITAFNFVLEVEGVYFMALKSVHVFNKENEYEYIREGGVNDYVHMRRKPISKPFTFQVERYVGTERFLDPLANGTELMLPVLLYVYRYKARSEIIDSAPAWPARIYTFTGCVVTSKEYGELNSEKSAILTETTTIAYRELMVVTNPFEESQEQPAWKFPHEETKWVFPENEYANTGALAKDKDYYEKKKFKFGPKDKSGRDVWVRKPDGDVTTKPQGAYADYKDEPKYARFPEISNSKIYDEATGKDGVKRRTRKDDGDKPYKTTKPRAEEFRPDTKVNWANNQNETSSRHYSYKPGEGGWEMKNGKGKPRWDIKLNKEDPHPWNATPAENGDAKPEPKEPLSEYKDAKPKYADPKNVKSPENYKEVTGKDGVSHTQYIGGDKRFDKPAYNQINEGVQPQWANAKNAVSQDHYTRKPGEGGWESTDDTAKPRTEEITESKPKWAVDTNAVSDDHYTPKPGEGGWEMSDGTAKPRWNIKENESDPKPENAEPSRNGDTLPPPKTPWSMKDHKDNPTPTYAEPSRNGDGKQPPKEPWDIKSNTKHPKVSYAVPAKNGDGKQPAKEPWDIKANKENPKPLYAAESPKDHEKPEAVKWPPTRRALMAESLSKK